MSGARKVSSVTIVLAPPRRAEVSQKNPTKSQWAEPRQRRPESPPSPPPEEPWSDHEELENGDLPSFPPNFLDEFPPEDDCLSPDLPPPPPPPPLLMSPKHNLRNSSPPRLSMSPKSGPRDPSPPRLPISPKSGPRDPSPPRLPISPKSGPRDPSPPRLPISPKSGPRDPSLPRLPISPKSGPRDPSPPRLPISPKHILRNPSPPPPPDTLSLELQKLEMAHSESQQKTVTLPAPSLVRPQSLPATQPKREDPAPGKLDINGHNGKPESSEICAFCHKVVLPSAPAIEAMKKHYHAACFTCRKCHRLLAGQLYYQKDGQPICEHCYKDTLEKCAKCQTLILQHIVRAMGNSYHPACFRCVVCQRPIADESFAVDEYDDVHCADDYYRKYAPTCGVCELPIIPQDGRDSYKIECIGRNFHENCYRCEKCRVLLSLEPTDRGCYPLKGHLLCKPCHLSWKDELC